MQFLGNNRGIYESEISKNNDSVNWIGGTEIEGK